MMRATLHLALLMWLIAGAANAHTRSQSFSVWEFTGDDVDLVVTVTDADALVIGADTLPTHLDQTIYPIAAGEPCSPVPPIGMLSAAPGFHRFDLTFKCRSANDMQIHNGAFFDRIPSHLDFAQIQNVVTGEFTEQLITADHTTIDVSVSAGTLHEASFFEFVGMGVMHILTGVDHMSFLLGLILISRKLRDLMFVVTGFTLGHSLTLALAVTGVLRPQAAFIDALVALTIVLIGAENLAAVTRRPGVIAVAMALTLVGMAVLRRFGLGDLPPLLLLGSALFASSYLLLSGRVADAGRLRLVITLMFGLIHGFGFASGLLEIQLPADRLLELLVGFNVGVEIGQLTLVCAVLALVRLAMVLRLRIARRAVVDIISSGLLTVGSYWFVTRCFG